MYSDRLRRIVSVFFALMLMWGCSNKDGALFVLSTDGALVVQPNTVGINVGTSHALKVYLINVDGTRSDVTLQSDWLSQSPEVATVDNTGLVTGISSGEAQMVVSHAGKQAQATVTVYDKVIQSLSISPVQALSFTGVATNFTANAVFEDGSQQDVTAFAQWSSSNTAVATIGSDGVANALTQGTVDIAAVYSGTSGTATLETALFKVPQVVCYKGSEISYRIAKCIIKLKYISF